MNASKIELENEKDEHVLAIGNERIKLSSTTAKILADIQFLRDRINKMKQFSKPHKATLENYENMLKARENVLAWLEKQKGSQLEKAV